MLPPRDNIPKSKKYKGSLVDLNNQEDESEDEPETAVHSAIALYDYDAGEDNEISFKEGDIITDIEFVTEDWWQGTTSNGGVGLFPANYVELTMLKFMVPNSSITSDNMPPRVKLPTMLPSRDNIPKSKKYKESLVDLNNQEDEPETAGQSAIGLYDYDAREDNEISFMEDDVITDIEFVSEDWWQGTTSNGEVGLFPANYVELT
ncbi:Actin-binding protein [Gigaspora margarita]|uniref:Actin-binding protein n=1 Tax=Gigaspora margarita TaxID=4874 RepID=A0A8H4B1W9_GIGMA|nr:Actin-binding protein [Gigaspora margarita]